MNAAPADSPDPKKIPSANVPQQPVSAPPPADAPPASPPLTPEEQMALFEQELKETDWGHQPC
jgi:hypothetical protein